MPEDSMISFPEGDRVFCRFWKDGCVIYNQLTGNTHLVDGLGMEIFKAVSEKTATRSVLLQQVQSIFDMPVDFDSEAFLDDFLLEYQNLGLLQTMEDSPA